MGSARRSNTRLRTEKETLPIMKMTKLAALVALIALVLFIALPNMAWAAEDGAALYKAKCAMCHGPDAAGKGKAPAIKGADEAKLKAAFGMAPHTAIAKSLSAEQVGALATYLKGLK
jgi:mono/diheme cytochrome c family protein